MATGEIIFDISLVKMKVDIKMTERVWKDADFKKSDELVANVKKGEIKLRRK
jgi:hypothetical protein